MITLLIYLLMTFAAFAQTPVDCGGGAGCQVKGNVSTTGTVAIGAPVPVSSPPAGPYVNSQYGVYENGVKVGGGSFCGALKTGELCARDAPYYASGSGTTTTTSGTTASGTAVTVASCASFAAADAGGQYGHQGVLIAGAGAAGGNYIGTVSTCVGTAMVVTPATSTSVATAAPVQHDDTAAIQAAITAAGSAGGKIILPDGYYRANGPRQDTGGANAILLLPSLAMTSDWQLAPVPSIVISGLTPAPYSLSSPVSTFGAVLQTDATAGNLIGAMGPTVNGYNISSIDLTIQNLTLRAPDNPAVTMINCTYCAMGQFMDLSIDTLVPVYSQTQPSHTNGVGLIMPGGGNYTKSYAKHVWVTGYYTGLMPSEHAVLEDVSLYQDQQAILLNWAGASHSMSGSRVNIQHCPYGWVSAGSSVIPISIQESNFENRATGAGSIGPAWGNVIDDVYDSGNLMAGVITVHLVATPGGDADAVNVSKVGAAHLQLLGLYQNPNPFWDGQHLGIGTNTPVEQLSMYKSSGYTTFRQDSGTVIGIMYAHSGDGVYAGSSSAYPYTLVSANQNSAQVDNSNTAGNTRFLLWDVDKGALSRVSVGAADSCGTGYKCLRVPN